MSICCLGNLVAEGECKAARQMVDAVEAGKKIVYVTRRWSFIGWLLRHFPE